MGQLSESQTPATRTGTPLTNLITHPSHPGCTFSLLMSDTSSQIYCDGCTGTVVGLHYHCNNHGHGHDRYDLHVSCYNMPPKINHQAHTCELFLTYTTPYPPKGFSCNICGQAGSNNQWLYRCNLHGFDAHLHCMGATNPSPQPTGAAAMNPYSNYDPQHTVHPAITTTQFYPHLQQPPFPHAPIYTNPQQVPTLFGSGQVYADGPRPGMPAKNVGRASGGLRSGLMKPILAGATAATAGFGVRSLLDKITHHGDSIPKESTGGDLSAGGVDIGGGLQEVPSEGGGIIEGLLGLLS